MKKSGKKSAAKSEKKRIERITPESFSKKYGLRFLNPALFELALTHSSYLNESDFKEDNQRLEYLGDSVLGLIINEHLFRNFPHYSEGDLARIKSHLVSESNLSRVAAGLNIGALIRMGKGEIMSGGRKRPSILADTLEALIGAIYVDQGLVAARQFTLKVIGTALDRVKRPSSVKDPKSVLQERVQKKINEVPVYEILTETGPKHKRHFVCCVFIGGSEIATGEGDSRKRAEQEAAQRALKIWS